MMNDTLTANPAEMRDIAREIFQQEVRRMLEGVPTMDEVRRSTSNAIQDHYARSTQPIVSSMDIHLRNIELAFSRIQADVSDINSKLGGYDVRIKTIEVQSDELTKAIHDPLTGLLATRNDMALIAAKVKELRDTIHGDPEERSGSPSLFELIEQQNRDRSAKHAELLNGQSTLVKRVETMEQFVERQRAIQASILNVGKKVFSLGTAAFHDWRFWVTVGGVLAAAAAAFFSQQQPVPNMFDLLR